jgi:chemotaxis protein CheD
MIGNSETVPLVKVGMAQYKVAPAPAKMMTLALGSCVGIVLYDPVARIGALAHVMHPRRERVKNNINRAKFADSVVDLMLGRMLRKGAVKSRIQAKLFGGATMFASVRGSRGVIQIGEENVQVTRTELMRRRIPIVADATGGERGRTILFDVADGSVHVKDAHHREEIF